MTTDSYAVVIVNAEPTSFQQRIFCSFEGWRAVLATHDTDNPGWEAVRQKSLFFPSCPIARPFVPQEILEISIRRGVLDRTPRTPASMSTSEKATRFFTSGAERFVTTPFDINELICSRTSR